MKRILLLVAAITLTTITASVFSSHTAHAQRKTEGGSGSGGGR